MWFSCDREIVLIIVSMFLRVSIVELSISRCLWPSPEIELARISRYFLKTKTSAEKPTAVISYNLV